MRNAECRMKIYRSSLLAGSAEIAFFLPLSRRPVAEHRAGGAEAGVVEWGGAGECAQQAANVANLPAVGRDVRGDVAEDADDGRRDPVPSAGDQRRDLTGGEGGDERRDSDRRQRLLFAIRLK